METIFRLRAMHAHRRPQTLDNIRRVSAEIKYCDAKTLRIAVHLQRTQQSLALILAQCTAAHIMPSMPSQGERNKRSRKRGGDADGC